MAEIWIREILPLVNINLIMTYFDRYRQVPILILIPIPLPIRAEALEQPAADATKDSRVDIGEKRMNRVALSELDLLESLNQLCDGLFWWYLLILASVTVYSLINALFLPEEEESIMKQYSFKKRSELLKWKRQFQGKWNNISRDGFYELMIFNGAPKKIAEKYRNMPYGQKIDIDEKKTE